MEKYKLEVAIDRGVEEFNKLSTEEQSPINMLLVARKYAPVTMKHCTDALVENPWLFVFEAKVGHKVLDVIIATVESYIAASIEYKVGLQRQNTAMEEARRATLADNLRIKRL